MAPQNDVLKAMERKKESERERQPTVGHYTKLHCKLLLHNTSTPSEWERGVGGGT